MTLPSTSKKCSNFPHSGPVGCLPAPNILPLAKETFAKGKMFWNIHNKFKNDFKYNFEKDVSLFSKSLTSIFTDIFQHVTYTKE